MIPAAPISARGPLGVVQLPRLWSKVLLNKKGLLQDGYYPCGQGFDKVVLDGLGLDREEVIAYLEENMPTYFDFERWVIEKKGGSIPKQTIDAINERILNFEYSDPKRAPALKEAVGLPADDPNTKTARLNEFDDWHQFHMIITG